MTVQLDQTRLVQTRRGFFKVSASVGAGLVLGLGLRKYAGSTSR